MSMETDSTRFARFFDFESEQVSIRDLIVHLKTMAFSDLEIGLANAMACGAAADLLERTARFLPMEEPGALINQLRSIDSDSWGEMA